MSKPKIDVGVAVWGPKLTLPEGSDSEATKRLLAYISEKLSEVMKGSTITESFGSGIYEMAQQAFDNFQQKIEAIIYYDGYEILSITGTKSTVDFIRWIMERNEEGSSDKIKFTYDEYETALNITFRPIDIPVNPVVIQCKLEGEGIKVQDVDSVPKVT